MPSDVYLPKILQQKAVYWPCIGRNDNGQPIYDDAEEIDCRWEDIAKLFTNAQGQTEVSRSEVYVDRDMKLDGVLWLGTLNTVADLDDPLTNENAWSIRYMKKIPNKKATKFVRIATL